MVQFLAMLFVLPLSRRAYRVANMIMMEALWSELIWLVDWWAGVKVGFFLWVCFVYGCSFQQKQFSSFSSPLVDVARKKGQGMSNGGIRSSEFSH